jgi:predicted AlkP superfamily phosphohydrolase/phosphomutase
MTRRMAIAARSVAKSVLPVGVRRTIASLNPDGRLRLLYAIALADVDWGTTRAFAIPMADSAQVRINLRGREPEGIVEPGADYDRLLEEIEEFVMGVVDADTGRPAADHVVVTREVTGRPVADVLPDLVILWSPGSPRRLRTPDGDVIDIPRRDRRSGEHSTTGFMIGTGPAITASGRLDVGEDEHSLLDVAPTLLTCLGVPVPDALPGRPIESLTGRSHQRRT